MSEAVNSQLLDIFSLHILQWLTFVREGSTSWVPSLSKHQTHLTYMQNDIYYVLLFHNTRFTLVTKNSTESHKLYPISFSTPDSSFLHITSYAEL